MARDEDPSAAPSYEVVAQQEEAHSADVNCIQWHPNTPGLLASAGDDGSIKLWQLRQLHQQSLEPSV